MSDLPDLISLSEWATDTCEMYVKVDYVYNLLNDIEQERPISASLEELKQVLGEEDD